MSRLTEDLGVVSGLGLVATLAAAIGAAIATAIPLPAFGAVRPVLTDENACIFQVPEKPGDPVVVWNCAPEFQKQVRTEADEAAKGDVYKTALTAGNVDLPAVDLAIKQAGQLVEQWSDRTKQGLVILFGWAIIVTFLSVIGAFRRRTKIGTSGAEIRQQIHDELMDMQTYDAVTRPAAGTAQNHI